VVCDVWCGGVELVFERERKKRLEKNVAVGIKINSPAAAKLSNFFFFGQKQKNLFAGMKKTCMDPDTVPPYKYTTTAPQRMYLEQEVT
jgi:hypothetical protein